MGMLEVNGTVIYSANGFFYSILCVIIVPILQIYKIVMEFAPPSQKPQ